MSDSSATSRVSVVIPVYQSVCDVEECLESMRRSGDLARAEIIVVDDCSNDGTAESVERRFPEVTLVRRPTNGGFTHAVNTGIAHVSPKSQFVALLNSDTIVERGWLEPALEAMRRDVRIGAVAPRVVLHDEPSIIDSAGHGYTIAGWAYRRGHGERFGPPFDRSGPVFGPAASAVIFRRKALDEQPFVFREELVCYYEDTELAMRLQLAGWRCLYVPESVVRHKVSRSYGRMPGHKAYQVSRNLELVFWEYMPGRLLGRAVWDHLLLTFLHGTGMVIQRHGLAFLKGKLTFLAHATAIWKRRRRRSKARDIGGWIERGWLPGVLRYRAR